MTIQIHAKVCSHCKAVQARLCFAGSEWTRKSQKRKCKVCAKQMRMQLNALGTGRLPAQAKITHRLPCSGESALLVKEPFATHILDGLKTLELRGISTNKRERIWVVSLETKRILGDVEIVGCVEYTRKEAAKLYEQHRISKELFRGFRYKKFYGYQLLRPKKLPGNYFHKSIPGPQSFVLLHVLQ